jgi:hypothetical protein
MFQMFWGIDKIARRDANRQQTFVWSHLPLEILGYPYMKKLALAASIAALALMTAACAKKDADATAPAETPAATDNAATAPAEQAATDAAPPAEAAPTEAAPAEPAPEAAPSETPPQQ